MAGLRYDLLGSPNSYLAMTALGVVFMVLSAWLLEPNPPEVKGKDAKPEPGTGLPLHVPPKPGKV